MLNLMSALLNRIFTPSSWPEGEFIVRLGIKLSIGAALLAGVFAFFGSAGLYLSVFVMLALFLFNQLNSVVFKALHILLNKPVMIILTSGYSVGSYFYTGVLAWGVISIAIFYLIIMVTPESEIRKFFRPIMRFMLTVFFNLEVEGEENFKNAGEIRLLIPNHPSFLDPLFISTIIPDKVIYAMHRGTAEKPFWSFITKVFASFAEIYKVDMQNTSAISSLIKLTSEGKTVCVFPEGRIQITGTLMLPQRGAAMIARKAKAKFVPININGLQYSMASRMTGKANRRFFPDVKLSIQPPCEVSEKGNKVSDVAMLYKIMSNAQFNAAPYRKTLFAGLLEAANKNGGDHVVVENYDDQGGVVSFSYNKLLVGSDILGRKIQKITQEKERVGMLLPNSAGTVVTFFALQRFGRVPAILNPIAGINQAVACAQAAELKTVLTSRLFLAKMEEKKQPESQEIIDTFVEKGINVVYLEDIKEEVSPADQLAGLVRANAWHERANPDDPAVVIFTSGSESLPKGVVLSHVNLMSNRYQMSAVIDFNSSDTILNAMPMFHSFGLLAGTLLPIFEGIKTFMYPDPKDFRMIPNVSYDVNATIIFGTDKFLSGYAKQAHAYHFKTLRAAFSGAEKLEDTTRRMWSDKLGVRVLEGYGATEASPVIAACTPMHPVPMSLYKGNDNIIPSTVGKLVPGMECKLEAFGEHDGISSGTLQVKGPNIMLGYLKHDKPGILQPTEDGWYNTGDVVKIDDEEFVSIIGRVKRFAKIGGEMIPLPQVDGMAVKLWSGFTHVACSIKDGPKEQIVLVSDCPDANVKELRGLAKVEGIPMIFVPSQVINVEKIPLLATGKVAFGEVDAIVVDTLTPEVAAEVTAEAVVN